MSAFPPTHHHLPNLPNLPQASAILMSAQNSAQDKISRELFVGNSPSGTSELLLLQFLNSAMRRVQLCQPNETPIINCRVNSKFSFIELVSVDMANRALNLNGIPFLGAVLKVSRPSKYMGPILPASTWQQITGVALPAGASMDADSLKLSKELFVGNTTSEMTEDMLKDHLNNAMVQVGLASNPGNPITSCRVSGKFAFIELRSSQEAANALNLNNIPFLGASLRVGRPSKWNGPPDKHGNWEDILAKYMSGELQMGGMNNTNQVNQQQQQQQQMQPAVAAVPPSRVVELQNMLTMQDLADETEYNDILEDTREECSQFGQLVSVIVPKASEVGATKIFLEYATLQDAAKAVQGLEGRTFDERRVIATYADEAKFASKNYA
jgi:RNA recognition motif-containing protein